LNTPLSKLDEALPLMADVLLRPDFPADELERKRRSALTNLLQFHDQPTAIAAVFFAESLYGKDHPYGRAGLTDEASIRSISVEDLRAFHDSYVRPNNAAVVVVGDVTMAEIKPRLERLFGGWEAREVPQATLPTPAQVEETEVLLVDKPGAAQSVIYIGRIGVPRKTDDYASLVVMNTVLGGSFTSRLNQNLREDKGWSYGAGSAFSFDHTPGPFRASSSVETEVTGPALAEFFMEMEGIQETIPQEELDRAKNYEALGYPASFGSVAGIAGQLNEMVAFDLPRDSFDRYVDQILSVTQAQAQAVARRYVVPGKMRVIVVGDREKIEEQIRDLNLGPMRILTVEEVLGPKPTLENQ
jgi:predicted Zn-dependent peptidase